MRPGGFRGGVRNESRIVSLPGFSLDTPAGIVDNASPPEEPGDSQKC